jgi:imidazolonepropionase-like amidohydrolase
VSSSIYRDAIAPYVQETRRLLPAGAEIIDAHTHLGLDEDGRSLRREQGLRVPPA